MAVILRRWSPSLAKDSQRRISALALTKRTKPPDSKQTRQARVARTLLSARPAASIAPFGKRDLIEAGFVKATLLAAERRKNAAHGVSRG